MAKWERTKCRQGKEVAVLHSNAGYYIGIYDEEGPYCRLSQEYYKNRKEAEYALENKIYMERESPEILYCNGSIRNCF